jgi:hypothetical protein
LVNFWSSKLLIRIRIRIHLKFWIRIRIHNTEKNTKNYQRMYIVHSVPSTVIIILSLQTIFISVHNLFTQVEDFGMECRHCREPIEDWRQKKVVQDHMRSIKHRKARRAFIKRNKTAAQVKRGDLESSKISNTPSNFC